MHSRHSCVQPEAAGSGGGGACRGEAGGCRPHLRATSTATRSRRPAPGGKSVIECDRTDADPVGLHDVRRNLFDVEPIFGKLKSWQLQLRGTQCLPPTALVAFLLKGEHDLALLSKHSDPEFVSHLLTQHAGSFEASCTRLLHADRVKLG